MKRHLLYLLFLSPFIICQLFGQEPDACGLAGADSTALLLFTRPLVSQLPYTVSTTHFVIHYATSGIDAFTTTGAQAVGVTAESCWTVQCVRLGWRTPQLDGTLGGDSRYDIYVLHFYNENPGPDTAGVTPNDAGSRTSYIMLTNHYGGGTDVSNAFLAHEFNHACQWSYGASGQAWIWEGTADYMMKEVFHSGYGYASYLGHADGSLTFSDRSLTQQTYANALFFQFLQERWSDTDIVRTMWERFAATGGTHPLSDINYVISTRHSSSLTLALRDYAIWRRFTGVRSDGHHFQNDSLYYSAIEASFTAPFTMDNSSSSQKPSGPGGCRFWNIKSGTGNLTVSFDGQDNHKWAVFLIGMRVPNSSSVYEIPLTSSLDTGRITVNTTGVDSFTVVPVVLDTVNANNLTFSVTASFVPTTQVTFSNRIHEAEAGGSLLLDNSDTVISSQSRNLIQSSTHTIRTLNERFVIPGDSAYKNHDWNRSRDLHTLADTFIVSSNPNQTEIANFFALNPVTVRNEIIGAPNINGGTILFKDPWFLNSGGVQPDSFITFTSPLSPTGAYSQSNGGVFLKQGDTTNLQPPYYSVRAPLSQTIGNFQCTFVGWEATGATLLQVGQGQQGYDTKAVVFNTANAVVKAKYQATSATIATIATQLTSSWNIVSVPDTVSDFRKSVLWPTAISNAWAYQGGAYVAKDTMAIGAGYWLKFSSSQSASYTGPPIFIATKSLALGWNLIGSISVPLAVSRIVKSDTGMHLSKYYKYNAAYFVADTIKPGYGYWIKSDKAGSLILNAASTANVSPSTSPEQPPDAPTPPAQPELFSPINPSVGSPIQVTFNWGGEQANGPYHLQVSTSQSFATLTYDNASVSGMSQTVGSLAYNTPYFWRVCEANMFGEGAWSETWSLTTTSGIVLTTTTVNTHPQLSWTIPSGITYPYKVYRYDCECGVDCGGSGSLLATVNSTTYTDQGVVVQGKFDACSSTSWYYVKGTMSGTSTLSSPSNKVSVNNSNISWKQAHRGEGQEENKNLPTETKLSANYPNPFNPTTTFEYQLAQPATVKLIVYNLLGQEVERLIDADLEAGYYSAVWNANTNSSSLYFARMIITDHSGKQLYQEMKKLLLIK